MSLPAAPTASQPHSDQQAGVSWADEKRRQAFEHWLLTLERHELDRASVRAASADASFRRYLRIDSPFGSRIVMDAPPSHEDCRPFVTVAKLLREGGLNAPEVIEWNEAEGFMLLSDLGSTTYLDRLDADNAPALYRDATDALVRMQSIAAEPFVPPYDRALLMRELQLFPDWYIERHGNVTLGEQEKNDLEQSFEAHPARVPRPALRAGASRLPLPQPHGVR